MISIEQALKIVEQQEIERKTSDVDLDDSHGFYLSEKISSPFDLPSFDNSAMDGYAVSGIYDYYEIVGEIAAGDTSEKSLQSGEAMRIFTGAKIPSNTTAVVMQERTNEEDSVLHVDERISEGQHIRRQGNELALGETVFAPGHLISPASVGLIGSLGLNRVTVFKKPDVRIISTGNELIPPGESKSEGQIYESNSYALQSALNRFGFECREKTHIKDDFSAVKSGIAEYLDRSDVLLLSGGISVGDYDFVKQALEENGVTQLFYKIFQKPGKPLYFGRKENKFVFALPGNPASSLTCFYIHVLPLLQRFSGAAETGLQRLSIPISHEFEYGSERPIFLKAHVDNQTVSILNRQSSSMIHSMAMGNALVFFDGPKSVPEGEIVEVILI
ncbi:molybdopterin molybdotransferase MoeA [Rhodohalobacter sulfatireducens]|uniref:Molybdopterin molybdenumtransferase n=1 Tax=Rhodohalobacter sulfatireducens TaxID=2911366 RepID=A0ABS9K8Y1_9BACT|nr:gephyrin-like molybdotransferase Glp [Rhodohalobacter sulfatireducens]MCG2587273.1 molybdopterin molybdotransferase MoeA [Rhodohalobacter sulfatireducens]